MIVNPITENNWARRQTIVREVCLHYNIPEEHAPWQSHTFSDSLVADVAKSSAARARNCITRANFPYAPCQTPA